MGTGCPVVGHRMKMSPSTSSMDDSKIASSEYGMLPNVGVVTAVAQDPQMYGCHVWIAPGVHRLRSLWFGAASSVGDRRVASITREKHCRIDHFPSYEPENAMR